MKSRSFRIGIFGGTFDPPHIGHLIIAEQARQQLRLDKVLFVPAYLPPHKTHGTDATARQRLAMLRMAVKGYRGLEVETLEIDRKGTSYTVDTLQALRQTYRRARFFLILGGDNFSQFKTWKSAGEIRRLTQLAVYHREGNHARIRSSSAGSAIVLGGALLRISSTLVRDKARKGESIRFLVPQAVERYIRRHKLYAR